MTETITSRKNEKIVHLKKLGADRSYRYACGQFLCDGEKLLEEAVDAGAEVGIVLYCGDKPAAVPADIEAYRVPRELIDAVSPLKGAQDVLFSCRMPESGGAIPNGSSIILENVQDPGNVGTVLRTAVAMGIGSVLLVGACADPFNPKTVRGTMGAIFRQKLMMVDYDALEQLVQRGTALYGAALGPESRDIREIDLKNAAVVIGSEGSGLTGRMLDICTGRLIIPMEPGCQSLNAAVAAAMVMWEMKKARVG